MNRKNFVNPFGQRPWMENTGAAVHSYKGLQGIIAGAITGGIEICITYPTEFVKTQLQLEERGKKCYAGIGDCVQKTVKKKGIFGLYRGLSVVLIGSIPKSAARFGAFETFRGYMIDERCQLTNTGKLVCGLGAGVCEAVFAVTPMETVKVKFINDQRSGNPKYKGFVHGVVTIIKEEGFRGIYKGVTPTVLKQGSNQAIRFFVVESLKDAYTGDNRSKPIPKPVVGIFGAVAGAASVLGNTPLDVIKTRMQGLDSAKYKNTIDCGMQIWQKEGPLGLYKGTLPRLGRVCLDVAITFMIYDTFMEFINSMWS